MLYNIIISYNVSLLYNYYSARLQIQERLVKDAVDELEKALKPKGIGLGLVNK